jgi:hypothetical protein
MIALAIVSAGKLRKWCRILATNENSWDETLIECLRDPSLVATISREAAKGLWLQVNALGAHLMTRWAAPDDSAIDEAVLTVAEASAFANISPSLLYDHWKAMPSAIKIGRALRFKKSGLLADLAALGDRPRPDAFEEPIASRREHAIPQVARRLRVAS